MAHIATILTIESGSLAAMLIKSPNIALINVNITSIERKTLLNISPNGAIR